MYNPTRPRITEASNGQRITFQISKKINYYIFNSILSESSCEKNCQIHPFEQSFFSLNQLTDSMNRSTQNSMPPENWRGRGVDYGAYSARPNGRNRMVSMFPLSLPAGPLDPREGDHDPLWFLRERIPSGPVSISSFPAPPNFYNQNQFLDNGATRTTRARHPAVDASPSFQVEWNMQAPEEESRLTQDEQKRALNKLKKEIYNPMPKWLSRRPNLYYRDNPIYSSRETENDKDEDGKRCAICLEDFEPKEVVTVTPCKHMFHEECIVPWVKSQGQCPVCRFAICERFGQNAAPSRNMNANDQFESELIAIMRAMGEAFVSENMRRII